MKFILLCLFLASVPAFATIDVRHLTPVTETHFRIFGKGIQNKTTGDSLALACAFVSELYGHPLSHPCNSMRFIYFKAGNTIAYYLSDKLIPGSYLIYEQDEQTRIFWGTKSNQITFDEKNTDELIEHSAKELINRLSLNQSFNRIASEATFNRNGWGWSSDPIKVNSESFENLVFTISTVYQTHLPKTHPYAGMVLLSD